MSHNYPSRLRCSGSLSDQPSLRTEANTGSDSRFRSSARFRTCSHLIFRSPHSHSHSHSHPHSHPYLVSVPVKTFVLSPVSAFFPYLSFYLSPHPSLFQLSFLYLLPFSLLFLLYLSFLILFRYLFSLLFSVLFPFIVPRRDILQNMFSHKCIWRSWVNECDEKVRGQT